MHASLSTARCEAERSAHAQTKMAPARSRTSQTLTCASCGCSPNDKQLFSCKAKIRCLSMKDEVPLRLVGDMATCKCRMYSLAGYLLEQRGTYQWSRIGIIGCRSSASRNLGSTLRTRGCTCASRKHIHSHTSLTANTCCAAQLHIVMRRCMPRRWSTRMVSTCAP